MLSCRVHIVKRNLPLLSVLSKAGSNLGQPVSTSLSSRRCGEIDISAARLTVKRMKDLTKAFSLEVVTWKPIETIVSAV